MFEEKRPIDYQLEDSYYKIAEYGAIAQLNWEEGCRAMADFFAERQIEFEERGSRYDDVTQF